MEFKSLRNIESSFRQIRLFGIVFLSLCAVVTVWSVWSSYRFAEKQREKIYVLDNGKSLMLALSQDLSQNRPAEARESDISGKDTRSPTVGRCQFLGTQGRYELSDDGKSFLGFPGT